MKQMTMTAPRGKCIKLNGMVGKSAKMNQNIEKHLCDNEEKILVGKLRIKSIKTD